jgi:serine/threonine-protein kinase
LGVERFLSEIRVTANLQHPNLLPLFDSGEAAGLLFYVMPYVDGESLRARLDREKQLPLDAGQRIATAVASALDYAHRHGVIHRDLKPDNILVRAEGGGLRPKIADFGIAKVLEGTTYTVSGALLGTCRYMSPEQVKTPALADHRSDIYSLGVTLYELVTGVPPFDGSHFSVMMSHVSETPRPPSVLRPDIPKALEDLILVTLAKDPADRPATCAALRERLLDAIDDDGRASNSIRLSNVGLAKSVEDTNRHAMVLVAADRFLSVL